LVNSLDRIESQTYTFTNVRENSRIEVFCHFPPEQPYEQPEKGYACKAFGQSSTDESSFYTVTAIDGAVAEYPNFNLFGFTFTITAPGFYFFKEIDLYTGVGDENDPSTWVY